MRKKGMGIAVLLFFTIQSCCKIRKCDEPQPSFTLPQFNQEPRVIPLSVNFIDEASGIIRSVAHPDHLWIHEDSNSPASIYLVQNDGTYRGKVDLPFANRDWEDISIGSGPEPGENYLYLSDTGDNKLIYDEYYIYRFKEPTNVSDPISDLAVIKFKYPDHKSYDVETLMVEPATKDLYLITKYQLNVRVYRLAYPQSTTSINTAEYMGNIPYYLITSGDVSSDGQELLLKAHDAIYYWKIKPGENLYTTLSRNHDIRAPYVLEPQGEGISWDISATGYYSISERAGSTTPIPLYFYSKK